MGKRTITSLLGFAMLFSMLVWPNQTKAAPTGTITVVPPSFELYANPGESVSEKLRVRNDSDSDAQYQVVVEDFKAVGEEGSIDLIDDQSNTSYSLAKWVNPSLKSFFLKAGEEREVSFTITVPKDAEPGGHYASVLVQVGGSANPQAGSAAVTPRVGSLLLLRVSGNVREDAVVETFKTTKSYYDKGPVTFELRLKNTGNNHIRPKGTIVITNMFGQKVTEVTLNGLNVLPGAIRKMDTKWSFTALLANRYTADVVATYGSQNKNLTASTSFIIFPKYLLIVYGSILLLIIILIAGRKNMRKIIHNLTK
jgi:hypothetical protein